MLVYVYGAGQYLSQHVHSVGTADVNSNLVFSICTSPRGVDEEKKESGHAETEPTAVSLVDPRSTN